jgi:hypothetical protein
MKNPITASGIEPSCSTVPQLTALPRSPLHIYIYENYRVRDFEKRVLRRVCGSKWDEIKGN